jgi:hypothetical protein
MGDRMRGDVNGRHETQKARPSATADGDDCNNLNCLLALLQHKPEAVTIKVSISKKPTHASARNEPCGISCIIHSIIRGEKETSPALLDRSHTTRSDQEFKQSVPPDAEWKRTDKGYVITFPAHSGGDGREEHANSHSPKPVKLQFPVKPRPSAHAIVDVYAPYEDPYYCADGSSAPECGTDVQSRKVSVLLHPPKHRNKQARARTHTHTHTHKYTSSISRNFLRKVH